MGNVNAKHREGQVETRGRRGALSRVGSFIKKNSSRVFSSSKVEKILDSNAIDQNTESLVPSPDKVHEISFRVWDLFEEQGELGRGSYGKIFSVKDKRTCETYAMKMMKSSDGKIFLRELKGMKALSGEKNCVKLFGAYRDPWFSYLLMEQSSGGDLFDYCVCRKGPSKEEEIWVMSEAILRAVAQCHDNHICHRDIKPENFLIFSDDQNSVVSTSTIKLVDFGMSEYMKEVQEPDLVGPSQDSVDCSDESQFKVNIARQRLGLGTLYYLSPEILQAVSTRSPLTAKSLKKSDVWAAGATIYYLFTQGFHAFYGTSKEDENVHLTSTKALIAEGNTRKPYWMSEGMWEMISSMLCVDEDERISASDALGKFFINRRKASDQDFTLYFRTALANFDSIPEILVLFSIQFLEVYLMKMDTFAVMQWMSQVQVSVGSPTKDDFFSQNMFERVLQSFPESEILCSADLFDKIHSWGSEKGLRRSYRAGISVNHVSVLLLMGQYLLHRDVLDRDYTLYCKVNGTDKCQFYSREELKSFVDGFVQKSRE